MKNSCKNCRFFSNNNSQKYIIDNAYNLCLRYPPKAAISKITATTPSEYEVSYSTISTTVHSDFWCGEFEPTEELK